MTSKPKAKPKPMPLVENTRHTLEPITGVDLAGKVVRVMEEFFRPELRQDADDLLFRCDGGFGCNPAALGTKVFGEFTDGEEACVPRPYIAGIVTDPDAFQKVHERMLACREAVAKMLPADAHYTVREIRLARADGDPAAGWVTVRVAVPVAKAPEMTAEEACGRPARIADPNFDPTF